MATIGTFKKTGNEYVGEIVTLSVQAKNVRIVPEEGSTNGNAPSHRVFVGRAEIGAAWSKRSNEGRDYLSLKLDDPSFTAPIYANLFDDTVVEGEETERPVRTPGRGVFTRQAFPSPSSSSAAGLTPSSRARRSSTSMLAA